MHIFDLQRHCWENTLPKGHYIHGRASFGMCHGPTPNTLIVAGGTFYDTWSGSNVMEYNTRKRMWTNVLSDFEDMPFRLYGQSACVYGDNLLLFGGSTGRHYSNDLYEYSTCSNRWRKLTTIGQKPSPRYKHQAVIMGQKMYIVGGGCFMPFTDVHCLDLETLVWEETEMRVRGRLRFPRVVFYILYSI